MVRNTDRGPAISLLGLLFLWYLHIIWMMHLSVQSIILVQIMLVLRKHFNPN